MRVSANYRSRKLIFGTYKGMRSRIWTVFLEDVSRLGPGVDLSAEEAAPEAAGAFGLQLLT